MDVLRSFMVANFTLPVPWPVALGLGAVVFAVLELSYRQVFRWIERLVGLTKTTLDDVLIRRMRVPGHVLILLISVDAVLTLRTIDTEASAKVLTITELLLLAYLVIEAVETTVLHYWLGERKGVQVPNIVRHLLLLVAYSAAVLAIVGNVTGINLAPLLATSTVITVVVGLALQETLGNLFAGLSMSMDRPFSDGDWILVDGVEGKVVRVGWRATHLQTFTRDIVVIPNSMLAKARLQNFRLPTPVTGRNLDIIVALHADPTAVEEAVAAALAAVPVVLADPMHKVWFVQTTPLHHRYIVRFYLGDFGVHDDAESDVMKALFRELSVRRLAITAGIAATTLDGAPAVLARP